MMTAEPPAVDPKGWYSATQASKVLGISRMTLLRYVRHGLIRPHMHKPTMRTRYLGRDLLAFWGRST